MPYIVKSSLDIGGKIIPWSEQEVNKLIKEKEEKVGKNQEEQIQQDEQVSEQVSEQDAEMEENAFKKKQDADMHLRRNKKRDKVGED